MTAALADIWNYANIDVTPDASGNYAPLASTNPAIQALIDNGTISREDRTYSNEGGSGRIVHDTVHWDSANMPTMGPPGVGNKLGNWQPVGGDPSKLINPSMVYNDPNYGMITPTFNDKTNQDKGWEKYIGPVIMGLGGAAMGMGIGGGLMGSLANIPSAARTLGSGGGAGSILGLLGGIAGGMSGLPMGSSLGRLAGGVAGSALSPKSSSSASPARAMTPQQVFASLSPTQKAMILMGARPKGK